MRLAIFTKMQVSGNSYVVRIPKEYRTILELKRGDLLRVEIEKVENNDTNLHDDNAARQDPKTRNKGIHQDA